jgi:DtxR family Mn-dependent transcriptional regulator
MVATRPEITPTLEDYLQAIDSLDNEEQLVIGARLAERLEVTPASVSQTVDRMLRLELIAVSKDHEISLTPSGRTAADSILRRHRLTERFLADVLDLDWSQAHTEAHRLEHAMSDLVQERLSSFMQHPTTCPHGGPIPGNFPEGGDDGWRLLSACSPADRLVVRRISEMVEGDPELLDYCAEKNLRPGVAVTVREAVPDGLFVLDVAGDTVAVSARLSAHIFCEPSGG